MVGTNISTRAEDIIEDMKRCSKTLAYVDADRLSTLNDIDDLEIRLANINNETSNQQRKNGTGDNSFKITAIQQVKNLRSELTKKEEYIRDLDDRISLEADKLQFLGNELKGLAATGGPGKSTTGISQMQTTADAKNNSRPKNMM